MPLRPSIDPLVKARKTVIRAAGPAWSAGGQDRWPEPAPHNRQPLAGEPVFGRLREAAAAGAARPYDLVVFDEAHKLAADRGRDFRVRKTDRYRLAEALAGLPVEEARRLGWSAANLLLLTATPHMGKDFPYYCLWRLLAPEARIDRAGARFRPTKPEAVAAIVEATRLSYGHLSNPAFAAERRQARISSIDPLPHQRIAVYEHRPRPCSARRRSGSWRAGLPRPRGPGGAVPGPASWSPPTPPARASTSSSAG